MGAWGTGLYQDDVALDIKEEYINRLKIGYSNIEATQELLDDSECYVEDEEEEPIFWFALADTQWKYGRLLPEVKEEAIKHIKEGKDLERWKDNKKQYEKRKQVLKQLEEKLNSPQPPEKKVTKLVLCKATWEVGDVLLFKINNEYLKSNKSEENKELVNSKWYNKYVLLRVIGISRINIGGLPMDRYYHEHNIVALYNWVGDNEPDINKIDQLNFLKQERPYSIIKEQNERDKIIDVMYVFDFNRRELKQLNFKVIKKDSKYKKPSEHIMSSVGICWPNINTINININNKLNEAEEKRKLVNETNK